MVIGLGLELCFYITKWSISATYNIFNYILWGSNKNIQNEIDDLKKEIAILKSYNSNNIVQ